MEKFLEITMPSEEVISRARAACAIRINERSISRDNPELGLGNLFAFAEQLFDRDSERLKEFLTPKRRPDGRYVTSEANLNKWIDLRIFRETQVKSFLRWLTITPVLKLFFNWFLIKKLHLKLSFFDLGEDKQIDKMYAHDEKDVIAKKEETSFTIHNLGHATQLIQTSGMNILTDPVFGKLAPIFYPSMTQSFRKDVKAENLPPIDVILISHNHRDHVDATSLRKLVHFQPQLLVPLGDEAFFRSLGFTRVESFQWHEEITLTSSSNKEITFCSVPADHRSGRKGHDSHKSLVMGWTISPKDRDEVLYFSGDTAKISNTRMDGLALNIYQLYQNKDKSLTQDLPRIINLEPGGPNYTRKDMQPTHQSAVDSVISAFRLAIALEKISAKDKGEENKVVAYKWLYATATVFMHHNKFELGPDRFNENVFIFNRLCSYLQLDEATLLKEKQKQNKKSSNWSLFHRRKDFILEGVDELKKMAKNIWPEESKSNLGFMLHSFIQSRTHFPLICQKLSSYDCYEFSEQSSFRPDAQDETKGKLKGQKAISAV